MRVWGLVLACLALAACVDETDGPTTEPVPVAQPAAVGTTTEAAPVAPVRNVFQVATGFQARNRGPGAARGAIYYFGGHSPSRPTPVSDNIVQPHVVSLNRAGWDVFRANAPIRLRRNDRRALLVNHMNALAADARAKGYRKVVYIGQSFGAWNIMAAAEKAQFDKFVAIAPATYGLAKNSRNLARWETQMLGIVPMAQKSRVPGLVFLFQDDEFYTARVQDGVAAGQTGRVRVIDRPKGFNGHGAGWLDAFDYVYSDCLARYLRSDATGFSCAPRALSPKDHRWMTTRDQLASGGAVAIDFETARQDFLGNTLAGRAGSSLLNIFFASKLVMKVEFRSGYNSGEVRSIALGRAGQALCTDDPYFKQGDSSGCYTLYKWPGQNLYFAVSEDGRIVFRGQVVPGNARQL